MKMPNCEKVIVFLCQLNPSEYDINMTLLWTC